MSPRLKIAFLQLNPLSEPQITEIIDASLAIILSSGVVTFMVYNNSTIQYFILLLQWYVQYVSDLQAVIL